MHQDYSPHAVVDRLDKCPSEVQAGEYIVKHCLKHLHWGVLEHSQITFNCVGFPHHVVMHLRTHRVGISFDVQSLRYCSEHILDVANHKRSPEELFFIRPPGHYTDRDGAKYDFTEEDYTERLGILYNLAKEYARAIAKGQSEEHARELMAMSIRQNFVLSVNARSLLHLLDVRSTKDVQLETQQFSQLLFKQFAIWMPQVAEWYAENRLGKNKLAP
jgi:thymidylate synthase (FAD)